ncbi:MAG: ParB/RepB/Spo0J family partition protein [Lachnospiraceae bacterium]
MVKKGLGKGLGAIFGEDVIKESEEETAKAKTAKTKNVVNASEEETGHELMVKVSLIEPNKEQPRKDFNEEQLQELADSIKNYGILQPLLVQKKGAFYEIIAGERRWRAAKMAGLKEIPVVLREYNRQQSVEIALIENVQRADLNPIEEAKAYQQLVKEFNLTQEEIAARVSKNRATITNTMRLLKLEDQIQEMLIQGMITSGHARALLSLENKDLQLKAAKQILDGSLSVRETEKLVKKLAKEAAGEDEKKEKKQDEARALIYQSLEERMKTVMGTKVSIHNKDKNKGRIEIEYYSEAELERLVEMIESIG